jgi:hypothetical protein
LTLCFELLDHGAFGLLAEPYDPDQLQWLINAATSRSKTLPRTPHAWRGEAAGGDLAIPVARRPSGAA